MTLINKVLKTSLKSRENEGIEKSTITSFGFFQGNNVIA